MLLDNKDGKFIIWREGYQGGSPTIRHPEAVVATEEANRLAHKYLGVDFTLYKLVPMGTFRTEVASVAKVKPDLFDELEVKDLPDELLKELKHPLARKELKRRAVP